MILHQHLCRSLRAGTRQHQPLNGPRWLSTSALERLKQPYQSYISTSHDPYVNLSIEHHLLQKSPPDSAILFLYVNRPSIIIGRNQNPWLEVNLALLKACEDQPGIKPPGPGAVDLVRRRSGGGTVFHDEGNVNWTVICPSADFTRDKHAEMVVRALRDCGIDRARVNARHDIVLDQGKRASDTDPDDTHCSPYEATDFDTPRPLKVSGSAYKLTRQRALHHGTALLNSPNLNVIPDYLHSPAKPFMTARGVESVSSPVGNILLGNGDFIDAVQTKFAEQYRTKEVVVEVDEGWLEDENVLKGYRELKSLEWTYLQTPQFSLTTQADTVPGVDFEISVRYGALNEGYVAVDGVKTDINQAAFGQQVHQIDSWLASLGHLFGKLSAEQQYRLSVWLEQMLPRLYR